jgi:hypothetical protein
MTPAEIKQWKEFPVTTAYILKLKAPFWSAGSKFKWDFEDKVGFGIDSKIISSNDEILIIYSTKGEGEKGYWLKTNQEFKYKENHRGTELVVVPREICKRIN